MKCPYCGEKDSKVIDSRLTKDGNVTRRRRECISCEKRFTTYEHIDTTPITIVKKDGRREAFIREKILGGITKACEKRNISVIDIEAFVDNLERDLRESAEKEISSATIGEKAMDYLKKIDDVAYVRFASVYREFKDVNDFFDELKNMLDKK